MAVNLSPVGGVAAQFFDNSGNVLTGGKIYTYLAGTTTPATTYTSSNGTVSWSNPIVLDASGRVSGSGEIWLTDGIQYKFLLKDSNDVLIATYDNIVGINSNFVNFTNQQEIQTATASQTVFNLTTMQYQPGTNNLSVFVDGVNQYGPGAQYAYVETDSDTVTFTSGLHVGAEVKFTTSQINSSAATDASQVSYIPPFVNSVATNVELKLSEYVSVIDFGAVGDGSTDDTAAIQAAIDTGKAVFIPAGTYKCSGITLDNSGQIIYGEGATQTILNDASSSDTVISITAAYVTVKDLSCTCVNTPTTVGDLTPVGIETGVSAHYATISNVHSDGFAVCIDLTGGIRSTIEKTRVNVGEFSYYGIGLTGGGEITVDNCSIFDASGDKFAGLGLLYVSNSPANVITNNYISRGRAKGIYVTAPSGSFSNNYIVIANNDIDFIYNWAIYIENYKQIHIKDNWLACGQRWNQTAPASGANVYQSATGQIYIKESSEFFVTNNDIYQSQGEYGGATAITPSEASHGLYLYDSHYGVISGNVSQDNSVGFYSEQDCSYNQFIGNTTGQLIGLAPEGTPQHTGFEDDGSGISNSYLSNLVVNLNTTANSNQYVGIDTYTQPDINLVTSWANIAYATFTSANAKITSAIAASGFANADANNCNIIAGKYYQATVYLVLNSGAAPNLNIYSGDGSTIDKTITLAAGMNTVVFQASTTGTLGHLNVSTSGATNYSLNAKMIEVTF